MLEGTQFSIDQTNVGTAQTNILLYYLWSDLKIASL